MESFNTKFDEKCEKQKSKYNLQVPNIKTKYSFYILSYQARVGIDTNHIYSKCFKVQD